MLSNQWKANSCGLLLVLIIILFTTALPAQADKPSSNDYSLVEAELSIKTYLPLITTPAYLLGKITNKGIPVANQSFTLYMFVEGNPPVTVPTTPTDANGDYRVVLPVLAAGQGLQLYWLNTAQNDSWLSSYICNAILANPVGDVNCSFDIENINLAVTPPSITLPYTFSWTKRSTPSDSYFFELHKPNTGAPNFTSGSLGYVDSYRLEGLPVGFEPNTSYTWWIKLCNPSGCGFSHYYHDISFQ